MYLLAGEQGVVSVCIGFLGLEVIIGLLEDSSVEVFFLVRRHFENLRCSTRSWYFHTWSLGKNTPFTR